MKKAGDAKMEVRDIKITDIRVSKFNIRKDLKEAGTEDTGLENLIESIKDKGLLSPVMVRKLDNGTYELIAGQRRFLACQRLGMETIPSIVRDITDDTDATVLSLVENVHRADLNPMDKARAYQTINAKYKDFGKVAKETGVSGPTIKKYLMLLKLAPSIQEKITTDENSASIGTLSKIADTFAPEDQQKVLDIIGGFNQQVQFEIIKRSDGDLNRLEDLTIQAHEGAFKIYLCKGLDECMYIPLEFRGTTHRSAE